MSAYHRTKHWLKTLRWQGRRTMASLRWGPGSLAQIVQKFGLAGLSFGFG